MVNFYVDRIRTGKMKVEDVPPRWRAEVEKVLRGDM